MDGDGGLGVEGTFVVEDVEGGSSTRTLRLPCLGYLRQVPHASTPIPHLHRIWRHMEPGIFPAEGATPLKASAGSRRTSCTWNTAGDGFALLGAGMPNALIDGMLGLSCLLLAVLAGQTLALTGNWG